MAPLCGFARIAFFLSAASPAHAVAFDLSGDDEAVADAAVATGGETLAGVPLPAESGAFEMDEEVPLASTPDHIRSHSKAVLLQGTWTPQQGLKDLGLMAMRPAEAMKVMDPNMASVVMSQVLDPLAKVPDASTSRTAQQLIQAREEKEEEQKEQEQEEQQEEEQQEEEQEEHHRHHKHHHKHHKHHKKVAAQDAEQVDGQQQSEQQQEDQPQPESPRKKHHHKTLHANTSQPAHKQTLLRIDPSLTPKSDKKFFTADYPNDDRPAPVDKFAHPYPHVQDSSKYAKDYVKDENNDSGEWKAQMDYDELKAKVAKERQEAKEALAKEQEERAKVEAKVGKEDAAAEEAKKAEEEEQEADKKAEAAEEDLDKVAAEKGTGKTDDPETVSEGTAKVEAAVKHLDGCKDKLDKARKQLDDILEKADKGEQHKAAAQAEVVKAEAKAASAQADVEKVKGQASGEKAEHDEALKVYEAEKEEAGKITKDLAKAEDRLKQLRNGEGPPPKAGAGGPGQPASFFHSGALARGPASLLALAPTLVVALNWA